MQLNFKHYDDYEKEVFDDIRNHYLIRSTSLNPMKTGYIIKNFSRRMAYVILKRPEALRIFDRMLVHQSVWNIVRYFRFY